MAFSPSVASYVDEYAKADLPSRQWFTDYFDFILDEPLRVRLSEEFYSTRYIYKILEGLTVTEELLIAQVRLQILQYASIYEAVLHHLLFDELAVRAEVVELLTIRKIKRYSVPAEMQAKLERHVHDGREIFAAYEDQHGVDQTKIRFDQKAKCAQRLGLIDEAMCGDLIRIYDSRNSIHLHAELRKGIQWEIEQSRTAYRRHMPFREQLTRGLQQYRR